MITAKSFHFALSIKKYLCWQSLAWMPYGQASDCLT